MANYKFSDTPRQSRSFMNSLSPLGRSVIQNECVLGLTEGALCEAIAFYRETIGLPTDPRIIQEECACLLADARHLDSMCRIIAAYHAELETTPIEELPQKYQWEYQDMIGRARQHLNIMMDLLSRYMGLRRNERCRESTLAELCTNYPRNDAFPAYTPTERIDRDIEYGSCMMETTLLAHIVAILAHIVTGAQIRW